MTDGVLAISPSTEGYKGIFLMTLKCEAQILYQGDPGST